MSESSERIEHRAHRDIRTARREARRTVAPGFTLIEIIVVIAIIALVAGMIMPRLTGRGQRAALIAADETADMLTLFAHRETMGHDNIAVYYDYESHALMLVELVGDPAMPDNPPRWEVDRFVAPVRLPDDMVVAQVREDDLRLEDKSWLIPIVAGRGRPSIEIALESPDVAVTIALPSYALSASVLYGDERLSETRRIIDLDLAGRDKEIW